MFFQFLVLLGVFSEGEKNSTFLGGVEFKNSLSLSKDLPKQRHNTKKGLLVFFGGMKQKNREKIKPTRTKNHLSWKNPGIMNTEIRWAEKTNIHI